MQSSVASSLREKFMPASSCLGQRERRGVYQHTLRSGKDFRTDTREFRHPTDREFRRAAL